MFCLKDNHENTDRVKLAQSPEAVAMSNQGRKDMMDWASGRGSEQS